MFPLNFGTGGLLYPIPYPVGWTNDRYNKNNLPEETREMIEDKRDEIESEEDIDDIIEEAYYRR